MQLVRRFRLSALFCALAVLVCELISRPFAAAGISDEGPYILTAQTLAATGHIVYNGWVEAMLGWQLLLGAAFIKLFGFSFTTVRMSTLLVAMTLAFFLQRIMVRAKISERNATIGTLVLVLSPLYLLLSVTFMSDIHGLFAIVLCLYGCLRALQASTSRATIGWLCFAVVTNALCGTSRQIAWLGVLVMVPSTLWLLRTQRRVLLAGAAATLAGVVFIFACMLWFQQQPYTVHAHVFVGSLSVAVLLRKLIDFFSDVPFLLLPIAALFLPQIRKSRPRSIAIVFAISLVYAGLAIHQGYLSLLEPTQGDWIKVSGGYGYLPKGTPPIFLPTGVRVLLTIISLGGLLGFALSFLHLHEIPTTDASSGVSWSQLGVILAPFSIAYILILIPRAGAVGVADRYTLELLVVALICIVRYYQEQIQSQVPFASILLVGVMAIYGIAVTHNMFAFYRARVTLAAELRANGVPEAYVDNGWEYNLVVELKHSKFINLPLIVNASHAYIPTPPLPAGTCSMYWYDYTPHIHPLYGVSFDPNACYGPAPFAPVHYSRWLASAPGTIYVVRYTPPSKP